MQQMKKRWQISAPITPEAARALQEYPPILRQILFNRGYSTHEQARMYMLAESPPGTDPFNLTGMSEAVQRILYALEHKEPFAIYGDYDADGVTATALLVESFRSLGADVTGYIPNRFEEGYGLNKEALESLSERGMRLVITVDCGIRSFEEADHARTLGMDLIISDHHQPLSQVPSALAVINPKQTLDPYPEKDLAGVGLAYKLVSALSQAMPGTSLDPKSYLDLVALGTVADLAPLVGENRALVRQGLLRLRRPVRQGILSLIGVAGLQPQQINAGHIGFMLGPRLNAAGRLDSALDALNLLITSEPATAARLAQQLDNQNRERQQVTRQIQEQAQAMALAEEPDALLLFAAHPDFNPGVVGLAASRLTEMFYRPAIVAHLGDHFTRGSCRSIAEFHITEALDQCSDLLEHHGGHAAAAGFTVSNNNLPLLVERLKSIAASQLANLDLRPTQIADLEIPLSDLKPEILEYLEWLQPTGYGNPSVYFVSRDLRVKSCRQVGREGNHLKLTVSDERITYDAIAFNKGDWYENMPSRIDLLYAFELNEYNGRAALQLNVRDIQAAGETGML